MGVSTWDEYLFDKHKIVAVDPWCGASLTLLDVFTKKGSYGIVNRGPKLARTGAMTGLGKKSTDSSPERSATAQAQTKLLQEARMGEGDHSQFHEHANIEATLKSSSKILASLSNIVSADSSKSKKLSVEASTVTSESIKEDFLTEEVQAGRWKPDPNSALMPKNWDHVLWVVVEIFYVKKLVIGKTSRAIAKVNMDPSKLVALAEPLPVNLQGKLEVSKAEDGTTAFEVPENGTAFPIGFKAIRLLYDKDGYLLAPGGIKLDIARDYRPKTRSAFNEWLDPDKFSDYHMKNDLFKQDSGGSMEALPMLVADEADEAEEASASKD